MHLRVGLKECLDVVGVFDRIAGVEQALAVLAENREEGPGDRLGSVRQTVAAAAASGLGKTFWPGSAAATAKEGARARAARMSVAKKEAYQEMTMI